MFKSINFLRFFFAVLIFVHHYPGTNIPLYSDVSVRFFFILSGFVLSHGYLNRIISNEFDYKNYIIKRISKIYPLHFILTILGIYLGRSELILSGKYIPLHIILFQSWVPDYYSYFSFSGVSWFLSSILFCYIIFPSILRNIVYKNQYFLYNFIFTIIIIRILISFIIPETYVTGYLYINPLIRSFDFTFGVVLYILYKRGINKTFYTVISIISICIYLLYHEIETYHLIWIPLGGIILLFIHYDKKENILFKLIHSSFFVTLGNISFSFFMIHIFIIKILYARLPFNNEVPKFFVIFSISLLLSLIWTYKIEPISSKFMVKYIKKII